MNSILRKTGFTFITLVMVFFFLACASNIANTSQELSPAELIQRAQEASDHNRYRTALQYYQVLLDRYYYNIELVCTAEYEIAFIHYKQKKYHDAREGLNSLLERYDSPDQELLPQQFKRLAQIVLERISEKEKPKFPLSLFVKNKEPA